MEVDCGVCGAYSDHHNAKSVCIHCFNKVVKENKKLKKMADKYAEQISLMADGVPYDKLDSYFHSSSNLKKTNSEEKV